ncbi:hypothetical protein BHM03_00021812 [Ensete ventricosum]|nr:hypothetical protein BHM03_00021812 [Ensete ventricosum]
MNAWIASEGWVSGIPQISLVNHPINRTRGSSIPWGRPRSDATVGLGRELTRKLSSNSLATSLQLWGAVVPHYRVALLGPVATGAFPAWVLVEGRLAVGLPPTA